MAAFNSRFREGKTQTYILEDVDAKTFDQLLLWVYTKTIEPERMKGLEMESPSKETQEKFDEEVMKFMKLWVLGDKLLMPELQNEVMAWITEMWKLGKCHLKSTSWIPYIWNHTNAGSLIRRFVRAHAMCWVEKDHCLQHSEDLSQELLMDVLTSAHEIYKISDKRQLWDEVREESNWFVLESF